MSKKNAPRPAPTPETDPSFEKAIASQTGPSLSSRSAAAPLCETSVHEVFFAAIRESKPNQTALAKQVHADPTLALHVDAKGFNALTLALLVKKPELAKVLIESGSDLNCSSQGMGWTPLVVACAASQGDDQLALLLIDKGANPASKTHDGLYALTAACTCGNLPLARLLLDKGAPADPSDAGWLPIVAAAGSSEALLTLLIDRGADPKRTLSSVNGYGPLHHAARSGNLACARILLDKKIKIDSVNADGDTPLHFAAQREDPAMVKFLLSAGSDARLENARKKTPGDVAATPELSKILEKAAAGKRIPSPLAGKKIKATDTEPTAQKTIKKTTAKTMPAQKISKAMGTLAAQAARKIKTSSSTKASVKAVALSSKNTSKNAPVPKKSDAKSSPTKKVTLAKKVVKSKK